MGIKEYKKLLKTLDALLVEREIKLVGEDSGEVIFMPIDDLRPMLEEQRLFTLNGLDISRKAHGEWRD